MSTPVRAVAVEKAPKMAAATITPRDPFERFDALYEQIARRAFEMFEGRGSRWGHDMDDWLKAEAEMLHPVHMTVSETEKAVQVKAEVPGFEANELAVGVEGRQLTITGKRETREEQKQGKATYGEQCSDEILRVIQLPAEVDGEKAEATLKNGVLQLQMPKTDKPQTTQVRLKVG